MICFTGLCTIRINKISRWDLFNKYTKFLESKECFIFKTLITFLKTKSFVSNSKEGCILTRVPKINILCLTELFYNKTTNILTIDNKLHNIEIKLWLK